MHARSRARFRVCTVLVFLSGLLLLTFRHTVRAPGYATGRPIHDDSPRLHDAHATLHFTEIECRRIFPRLTGQLEEARSQGPFELPFRNRVVLQGKIENGELYVLSGARKGDMTSTMLHRQTATLQQIYRAVKTSPEILPNMTIAFGTQDQPVSSTMSYARPVLSPSGKRIFPMPHFSFWSWPLPFINSIPAASRAIAEMESPAGKTPRFQDKDPRAVWRGTTWFNSGAGSHPRLRHELVKKAAGKAWADIQGLQWTSGGREAANAIPIHDFCRYKYIVYTEGIGYSGRLQFHQLCRSVLLSPPLEWMQHTTHLVKPAFSSTVLGLGSDGPDGPGAAFPTVYERERWPREYPVEEANMIFVASDWSDLEATVEWLEAHQDAAERIASNQRRIFHDEGYLSPAAEVCYWRSLLRTWGALAQPIGGEWKEQGMSAEQFLTGPEDME